MYAYFIQRHRRIRYFATFSWILHFIRDKTIKSLIARIICRPSGLFHYWCLLWMFTFHPVSETELHASVMLNDYLVYQRYKCPSFKSCALFLFFQHMEE